MTGQTGRTTRPDQSMTLITEMMERPLDPGYAAAAERRTAAGLPPATGQRSLLLVIAAMVIGAMLGASALALRTPTAAASRVKQGLVSRIEDGRSHADAQTRVIATLRSEINAAQAAALTQQSQAGLSNELSMLERMSGTVAVTGPGLVLTVDDAKAKAEQVEPDSDQRTATGPDEGKVIARDLQIIVNGLWSAGAEAISINGHRLTSRAAIRSAGEAILVNYRPLTRPYVVTAIGDPGSLGVEFADNTGGSYLQSLASNHQVRSDIKSRTSVVVPGEPTLSLEKAKPVESAVTDQRTDQQADQKATGSPTSSDGASTPKTSQPTATRTTSATRTTETSP